MASWVKMLGVLGWAAVLLLGIVLFMCFFPQLFTPYDPLQTHASDAFEPPSFAHPLGTDQVGRDVWSRIAFGAQSSVLTGVLATVLALVFGSAIGAVSAMLRRGLSFSVNRSTEVLMAVPELLIALLVVALLGPGALSVFVAISIASIPAYANVTRVTAVAVRQSDSVQTAQVLGVSKSTLFSRYILLQSIQPALALSAIGVGAAILTAAGLSFLGLGVQAPTPNWGLMLAEAQDYLSRGWWLIIFPGLALSITVASLMTLGRVMQRWMR